MVGFMLVDHLQWLIFMVRLESEMSELAGSLRDLNAEESFAANELPITMDILTAVISHRTGGGCANPTSSLPTRVGRFHLSLITIGEHLSLSLSIDLRRRQSLPPNNQTQMYWYYDVFT